MAAMKRGGIQSIGDLLASVFARRKWDRRLALHEVFSFWKQAVGREIAVHARPDVIRQDVLWVKVSDPIWMQQLHFNKQLLLDKINGRLRGGVAFTDIRFQLGYGNDPASDDKPAAVAGKIAPSPPRPVPSSLADALTEVEEDALREAIRRAFQRSSG
ncbi:MAG: DUF721 domain-containing protein [Thermodesulfobacteriota bacterium]